MNPFYIIAAVFGSLGVVHQVLTGGKKQAETITPAKAQEQITPEPETIEPKIEAQEEKPGAPIEEQNINQE